MFCYWYKDCRGKDTTNPDYFKFIQTSTMPEAQLLVISVKEQSRCFEVLHKPTRIRMVSLHNGAPHYGPWHT